MAHYNWQIVVWMANTSRGSPFDPNLMHSNSFDARGPRITQINEFDLWPKWTRPLNNLRHVFGRASYKPLKSWEKIRPKAHSNTNDLWPEWPWSLHRSNPAGVTSTCRFEPDSSYWISTSWYMYFDLCEPLRENLWISQFAHERSLGYLQCCAYQNSRKVKNERFLKLEQVWNAF